MKENDVEITWKNGNKEQAKMEFIDSKIYLSIGSEKRFVSLDSILKQGEVKVLNVSMI